MAEQWYYVDGAGGQAGPVDVDGLKGLLKSNDITMETLVWCDGQGDWEGIDDLPALKARVKPKSKPPPPPVPAKKNPFAKKNLGRVAPEGMDQGVRYS